MTKAKKMLLCRDVIFKAVFLRESEILLKMISDVTGMEKEQSFEEILAGYELEPYKINGKVNKSDMLIKINKNNFINCEINYKHEKDVLFRNLIQLFRICIQVTESGMTDEELSTKRFKQINFNTFGNNNKKVIQRGKYRDDEGNIINNLLTSWNFNIVKCYKIVYNNIENVHKLPKTVRWCAILYSDINDIKFIKKIIGDDLLTMEQRVKLINRINDVKDDKHIIQEWMVEENNRMREANILKTAKEDGEKTGMKKGLKQGKKQGIEIGKEEGKKQGIEIGKEEGKKQGIELNKIEMIKNMLIKNTDYNFISEITGKSISEIKDIEKNISIPNITM